MITSDVRGQQTALEIWNNDTGIPKQDIKRVSNSYFTGANSPSYAGWEKREGDGRQASSGGRRTEHHSNSEQTNLCSVGRVTAEAAIARAIIHSPLAAGRRANEKSRFQVLMI
ncbi:hypothetical protein A9P44_14305 [Paenibacillus polymyxa]|nr:hypothetical protein A9P44_14305 [Paenibacillus polymyxa]